MSVGSSQTTTKDLDALAVDAKMTTLPEKIFEFLTEIANFQRM